MNELKEAILSLTASISLPRLIRAREELTERYTQQSKELMSTDDHRYAYIVSRMPATFGVIQTVLKELQMRIPNLTVESLLDLGSGPGTVMWAASELLPSLKKFTLIEQDQQLNKIGQKLASKSSCTNMQKACWLVHDLKELPPLKKHDLVTMSYVAGELPEEVLKPLVNQLWELTDKYLVFIEPGTPVGFNCIRMIREQLIDLGANMVAPCPHAKQCPISGKDWCHFSKRVERSSLHRQIKGGSLGYEDEKFSYIIFSKEACVLPQHRLLSDIKKRTGHLYIWACEQSGEIKDQIISKRNPELYREAKKFTWGDSF